VSELYHLIHPRGLNTDAPGPGLLVLHGWGADENDLLGLAPFFDDRFFVVSPRAPIDIGFGGYGWYQISAGSAPDRTTFDYAVEVLNEFIAALPGKYPILPEQLFVLGFSQGAVMSAYLTLENAKHFAGSVPLSGAVPQVLPERSDTVNGHPVFNVHGIYDPVIAVDRGRALRDLMIERGADVEYHEYRYGHEITMETIEDLNRWFAAHLPEPA
jgi:phospholipase/carboxylesterase